MEDAKSFARRMYKLFQAGLSLDTLDLVPEIEVPDDPDVEPGDDTTNIDENDDEKKEL